ncbi:MAG: peptide deformylase [Elusimicrobia bacterium]|nr:peptide deformylase [Elusimicrobiota bacterium]MBI3012486.1 peptide deformylase [Elusimicrobiota bacterium]MBI4217580.1 peptide deformylase [Elusimicrobiota bacterium]
MIRKIVKHGDPVLRKKCPPVNVITAEIRKLVKDMLETLYDAPGIGLAANQIGVSLSLAVIDLQLNQKRAPIVLINPQVVETKGELFEEEGCLSIPGLLARTKRYSFAKVFALNENGLPMTYQGEGLLARALQHETDHLNGKFYIDRLPLFRRLKIQGEIRKRKKTNLWG